MGFDPNVPLVGIRDLTFGYSVKKVLDKALFFIASGYEFVLVSSVGFQ